MLWLSPGCYSLVKEEEEGPPAEEGAAAAAAAAKLTSGSNGRWFCLGSVSVEVNIGGKGEWERREESWVSK